MEKNSLSYAALGFSALACVLAALTMTKSPPPPLETGAALVPDAGGDKALFEEVARLRAELDRLTAESRASSSTLEPPERSPVQVAVPPELLQRLQGVEESVATLENQAKERAARNPSPAPAALKDPREAQRLATDPRTSEQEKLVALAALRGQTVDGQDARSHEVVLSMIDLAERSPDEKVREDVYRQLHGVKDPSLRDAMLRALANDPSAKVRGRAAMDIDTFLPDGLVESALRQAADNDADAGVRKMALRTLSGKR